MNHKYKIVWLSEDLEGYECTKCGHQTVDPEDYSICYIRESAKTQIEDLYRLVIKKLDGSRIFGVDIDLNNPKHLVVGAYLYGWTVEHGKEVYKVLENFRR